MSKRVLFYVSGHGFGHAVRSAEIVRALARRGALDELHVRTTAPAHLFEVTTGTPVRVSRTELDAGAVEEDPLTVHPRRTLERAAALLSVRERILADEAAYVRQAGIGLIVADVPFLAGEVGASAGVPCIASGNFLWSWIYEPYVAELPEFSPVLDQVRQGYRRMQLWLRMPFAHTGDLIAEVQDVPLVARMPTRPLAEVWRSLGLEPVDPRPRILLGMRGGMPPDLVNVVTSQCPQFLFVELGTGTASRRENLKQVRLAEGVMFTDVLNACDAVVSKLGYGIVAECVSTGTAILWPRRTGFREDEITTADAPRHLRSREIALADYRGGDWGPHLRALLDAPPPSTRMASGGAEVCAGIIERWLE